MQIAWRLWYELCGKLLNSSKCLYLFCRCYCLFSFFCYFSSKKNSYSFKSRISSNQLTKTKIGTIFARLLFDSVQFGVFKIIFSIEKIRTKNMFLLLFAIVVSKKTAKSKLLSLQINAQKWFYIWYIYYFGKCDVYFETSILNYDNFCQIETVYSTLGFSNLTGR